MKIKDVHQTRKTKTGTTEFDQVIFYGKGGRMMTNHLSKYRIAKTICVVLSISLFLSLCIEAWMIYHPTVIVEPCPNTIDMYQATMSGGLILDK